MNDIASNASMTVAAQPVENEATADPLKADKPKYETSHTFKLTTPVKFRNQTLDSVTIRAPRGLDVFEIGQLPSENVYTETGMTVHMRGDVLKLYLKRLSDYDEPVFYAMLACDLRTIYDWLVLQLRSAGN